MQIVTKARLASGAKQVRRQSKKNVAVGEAHIKSTFNNTIVTITDPTGGVISWASAGTVGFKGSRKSTPFAAQMAAEAAGRRALEHGVKKIDVFVKGPGLGRESAIRSLGEIGLEVGTIHDTTPAPRSGTRKPIAKPRVIEGGTRPDVQSLVAAVVQRLGELPASIEISAQDIERAVSALIDALPDATAPEQEFGPFYTAVGLARRWNVSRQAINARVQRGTLLGLPASDGTTLFPSFQFGNQIGGLNLLPGVGEVLKVLFEGGAGPMMAASWLTTSQPELNGASAVDYLRLRQSRDVVLALATADAERWQS